MKRFYTFTLLLAFAVFSLAAVQAIAQETTVDPPTGPSFVDENADGICDNFQNGGIGLGLGNGKGNRANFVDDDKDGVCDNFQSGQRKGRGAGNGRGIRANFVDDDKDGICDNFGTGMGNGTRGGRGQGGRLRNNTQNAAPKK